MRIGLVVPGGVDRSGTNRVIPALLALIERLTRVHEVHIFALRQEARPSTYRLMGATVHNVGDRRRGLRALRAIARENAAARFDLLHAFWAVPGVIAGLAGRTLRIPVLLHLIGGDVVALPGIEYGLLRTRRGRTWLRLASTCADRIAVESSFMQRCARKLGIEAERLPLGVDLARWPVVRPRESLQPTRLLQVADLNRVKDQSTLLLAVHQLAQSGIDFELDLIGVDTLGGSIQAQARALGLQDRIRFHGFLPHAQCRSHFLAADLLVVSSQHEAAPVAALEAAVCGVPVVGTRVGFLADWAPEAAVAVTPRDANALAAAIAALLDDPERRLAIARAAQRIAVREDADWSTAQILQVYEEMAAQRADVRGRVPVSAGQTA